MKIELFSIKDNLVGHSQPFCAVSEQVAIRQFIGSANSEQPNIVNTYPENKELWKLGSVDDQTGVLESDVKYLCRASDFINKEVVTHEDSAECDTCN